MNKSSKKAGSKELGGRAALELVSAIKTRSYLYPKCLLFEKGLYVGWQIFVDAHMAHIQKGNHTHTLVLQEPVKPEMAKTEALKESWVDPHARDLLRQQSKRRNCNQYLLSQKWSGYMSLFCWSP